MKKRPDPIMPHAKRTRKEMDEIRQNANRVHVYPTLTMRQASIIIECMKIGMDGGLEVEGQYVSADEWIELTKTLLR